MRCAASVILYRDLGVANSEAFLEKMERIASEFVTVCQRKDAVTIELYDPPSNTISLKTHEISSKEIVGS